MPLNRTPAKPITDEDRATYARDGVVCLRGVFDPEWIETLVPAAYRLAAGEDFGLLPTFPGRNTVRTIPEFRRFVFDSPMAEAGARVIGATEARLFFDEVFAKPPQSTAKTIWHCDRMGWPVEGKMVPSLWIPITPITKSNCLECLAGSQTQDVRYWLFSSNARKMIKPDDRPGHPDCEPLRNDPAARILSWDMEPGDMLVLHPWTLHYSGGNPTAQWRIALSVRIFGDDIVWAPRPDCVNLAGVSFDEMLEEQRPKGPLFPLLWSERGDRDDDSAYPRGFATTWDIARRTAVNDDFETLLAKPGYQTSSVSTS
jgi:ectoine hydroxylase-related dioxygenase (phytanoyl-CoA dioxygenase family)